MMASLGKPDGMPWSDWLVLHGAQAHLRSHRRAVWSRTASTPRAKNARHLREEISTEQWQRLNRLYHHIHSPHAQSQFRSSANDARLASIVDGIYLFKGTTDTTMIHGQGWQFIRLGRYLERAYATATLLEVYQPELFHPSTSEGATHLYLGCRLLCAAVLPSRRTARSTPPIFRPTGNLEFLLLNRDFPTPSVTAGQTARARPLNASCPVILSTWRGSTVVWSRLPNTPGDGRQL